MHAGRDYHAIDKTVAQHLRSRIDHTRARVPEDARLLDAEAVEGAARPYVEPPAAERRRGMDFVAEIVDAQDLPLRRRLQDCDLALHVCQKNLAVGCYRRRVVLAQRYFKPSFFPAASSAIDSRMRLSRVSGRFAI